MCRSSTATTLRWPKALKARRCGGGMGRNRLPGDGWVRRPWWSMPDSWRICWRARRSSLARAMPRSRILRSCGPVLALLKAATAVARAREATAATGVEHVPVFWLATEDHDLEEVDQVSLLTKTSVETLKMGLKVAHAVPVGGVVPGPELESVLERASELLEFAPVSEWLQDCYLLKNGARPTLALAFGRLMARIFAEQGLVVMDA